MREVIISTLVTTTILLFGSWAFAQTPRGIPVLTYHQISSTAPDHSWLLGLEGPTVVNINMFNSQMNWLKANGYKTLRLQQFQDILLGLRPMPKKTVLIAFDDGWDSQLQVISLLKRLSFHATFAPLINPGWAGWEDYYMHPNDIAWLDTNRAGFDIVAHTVSHPDLLDLLNQGNYAEIYFQLETAKSTLEAITGHEIDSHVWTYGSYNQELIDIAVSLGFNYLFTVNPGLNNATTNPLEIYRTNIDGSCGMSEFIQAVKTGANFFCGP